VHLIRRELKIIELLAGDIFNSRNKFTLKGNHLSQRSKNGEGIADDIGFPKKNVFSDSMSTLLNRLRTSARTKS